MKKLIVILIILLFAGGCCNWTPSLLYCPVCEEENLRVIAIDFLEQAE